MSGSHLAIPANLDGFAKPDLHGEWKEYWEATGRGELLIQSCPSCGSRQFYPRIICKACGGKPEWLKASGRGTLYTFSVVRQNATPQFKDRVPYVLAMVDLDEGVRMMSAVVGCDLDEVKIGMPLKLIFVESDEGFAAPYFVPG